MPARGQVTGQSRVDLVHTPAHTGQQTHPGRILQHRPPLRLADSREPVWYSLGHRKEHQDILVGYAVEQADRRQQPPGLLGKVGVGVSNARWKRRGSIRSGLLLRRERDRAAEVGHKVIRFDSVQAGQGQAHRQWVAVQPLQQVAKGPFPSPYLRGRVGAQQVGGVFGGFGPVQPTDPDPPDIAQPPFLRTAGDQHGAGRMIANPLQEALQCGTTVLIEWRGCPGGIGQFTDRLEVVPHQQHPQLGKQLLHLAQPAGMVQPGEVGTKRRQTQAGDDAVQAEGGHAGLERVPEHQPRITDATGVAPPAGKALGQFCLPGTARTNEHHHALATGCGLQLIEQIVAADEHAIDGRQWILRRWRL